eukprot:CAMPEP_0194182868 /NCGR_PEP_ID=MMETSP0154-20130528/27867_1 /TAXON_ID=1049557 /ORGANISM="Thalassiothrix antarctica, Strain L6-D1" /LENGTH=419 /DNA_ID=CAMNT_0038899427 /DNA_START=53 /DNA_END=1309 /DNA_ORIENTATION=+
MAPRLSKKRRYLAARTLPELHVLLQQLHEWIHGKDSCDRIQGVKDAKEAARAVSDAQEVATYEQSLIGWWEWYIKYKKVKDDTSRESLFREVIQLSTQQIKNPQEQLIKLPTLEKKLSHPDLLRLLRSLQPTPNNEYTQKDAYDISKVLWPLVEHDNGIDGEWDYNWIQINNGQIFRGGTGRGKDGLAELLWQLWKLARQKVRAVTLSVRVRTTSRLHNLCEELDDHYQMSSTICPPTLWGKGPPKTAARVSSGAPSENVRANRLPYGTDKRYYLILGTPGALTKSHWDRGVQAVLYHTVAGTNHALAIPRRIALLLQAIDDGVYEQLGPLDEQNDSVGWGLKLEYEALKSCKPVVKSGTFEMNESMLILPGGGHAVLTGDSGKVVIAGEWHLRTDISCMTPKKIIMQHKSSKHSKSAS